MKKMLYPRRVVLAEGYPWFFGTGPYYQMEMEVEPLKSSPVPLNVTRELWDRSVPRYRLVLERLK